eukprot:g9427.t1
MVLDVLRLRSTGSCTVAAAGFAAAIGLRHQVNLVDAGLVEPLVRQLKEGTGDERVAVATALSRLARRNPTGQLEIVVAGAVTPLRKQLLAATAIQRVAAAVCISRSLGQVQSSLVEGNPETQRAFSVEGAGRLLVGMLNAQTYEERIHAAVALGHLATENDETQARLVEGGAVEKLAELLKAEDGLERDAAGRSATRLASGEVRWFRAWRFPGAREDCASFALANTLQLSYDQIVKDVAEAQEVDVAIQIWNNNLNGRKRQTMIQPKKNPKFFFRTASEEEEEESPTICFVLREYPSFWKPSALRTVSFVAPLRVSHSRLQRWVTARVSAPSGEVEMNELAGGFYRGDRVLCNGMPGMVFGKPARAACVRISVSVMYDDGTVKDERVANLQLLEDLEDAGEPLPGPAPAASPPPIPARALAEEAAEAEGDGDEDLDTTQLQPGPRLPVPKIQGIGRRAGIEEPEARRLPEPPAEKLAMNSWTG